MASRSKTYDVFISHAAGDTPLAAELANACRAGGLEAITGAELLPRGATEDEMWEALAECRAVIVILAPAGLTPSMGIEVGAARAWNKPIYAVLTDPASTRMPVSMTDLKVYPPSRIDDAIELIKHGEQLTDDDRSRLADIYRDLRVSVDELTLDPHGMRELVKRFRERTGKTVSGERLLSELFRMRKQGRLKKSPPAGRR
jgi:hypothetical protein